MFVHFIKLYNFGIKDMCSNHSKTFVVSVKLKELAINSHQPTRPPPTPHSPFLRNDRRLFRDRLQCPCDPAGEEVVESKWVRMWVKPVQTGTYWRAVCP